jgi:hypothetical protein
VSRDALSAAAAVQAVLLVVALERTPESALIEAEEALRRAGVRPAGIVLFGTARVTARYPQISRRRRLGSYRARPERAGSA